VYVQASPQANWLPPSSTAGYVARRFLYSTAARCVFLDADADAGFILLGSRQRKNGQSIATIDFQPRRVCRRRPVADRHLAASIGCT
jgi:hypothetical protein